jgi:hypothetical protein
LAIERAAREIVHALREALEERFGGEFVERRLGALEEHFSEPLPAQAPAHEDVEHSDVVRVVDLESLPRIAVDERVDAEIAVRMIELEIQARFVEWGFFLVAAVVAVFIATGQSTRASKDRRCSKRYGGPQMLHVAHIAFS